MIGSKGSAGPESTWQMIAGVRSPKARPGEMSACQAGSTWAHSKGGVHQKRRGSSLRQGLGCAQVNGKMQTSNPDIYAVGDVAAFPNSYGQSKMARQEHVANCRQSAKHAGA